MKVRLLVSAIFAIAGFLSLTQGQAHASILGPLYSSAAQVSHNLIVSDANTATQRSDSVTSFVVTNPDARDQFPRHYRAAALAALPATGNSAQTIAPAGSASVSPLDKFVAQVNNGRADVVAGVYVDGVLALKVIQQPANDVNYISPMRGTATHFGFAAQAGTLGLLAHNYSSGDLFSNLVVGQEVDVVYGDGSVHRYQVSTVRHFQALSPMDPYTNLADLDNGNAQLSSTDVFNQVYGGGGMVVFQTCIKANGDSSWGRLFVTASPIS